MKGLIKRLRPTEQPVEEKQPQNDTENPTPLTGEAEAEAHKSANLDTQQVNGSAEALSDDVQEGVQNVEAITTVWKGWHLWAAYILIWLIYFCNALQETVTLSMTPYITSAFNGHSLIATTSIMSGLIGGLFKLPLAKILDVWGRPQGYLFMTVLMIVGLIMMAGCQNVETYAAAQVFYWVGFDGISYALDIFVADTSSLRNRSLMFAFASSPYIITCWIGGPIATAFLDGPGFRWGFGAWTIITPGVLLPLWALFQYNEHRAKKLGLITRRRSGRTLLQSLWHYFIEFDIPGLLLLTAGWALFLLSFDLYTYQADGWKDPMIICFIIFGGLLLIAFAFYEKYVAPVTFIPWELLLDRTVLGAYIFAATLYVEWYLWDTYFSSFLQVVYGLTVTEASYIANIYSVGSCFWAFIVGAAVRYTGRFKWIAVFFAVPLTILGVGLMIKFRQPGVNIGYIVMCQIFIAFGGGAGVICEQMAAMAAASHQHVAVVLAVEGMFASIGGSIGSTVSGAIWQGVFPKRLAKYLPASAQADLTSIYDSIDVQLSYPVGSATRDAINQAYGDTMRYQLIAGTCVLVLAIVSSIAWRDIKVKDFKQVKGRVV